MNWTCPFCNRPQTVTSPKVHAALQHIFVEKHALGNVGLRVVSVGCANSECRELTISVELWNDHIDSGWKISGSEPLNRWKLRPESSAKPFPDYIPKPIRDDYREACLIKDLSAKASATLSRRCLQGMIRDFGKIKAGQLYGEITELTEAVETGTAPRDVSSESIAALNAIRRLGNIGAHMEKNVDLVVDVDPGEAQALIEVIELLLEDWYVERHNRAAKFKALLAIDGEKMNLIKSKRAAHKQLPSPAPKESDGAAEE